MSRAENMATLALYAVVVLYGTCALMMALIVLAESTRAPNSCAMYDWPCKIAHLSVSRELVIFGCTVVWVMAYVLAFPFLCALGKTRRISQGTQSDFLSVVCKDVDVARLLVRAAMGLLK